MCSLAGGLDMRHGILRMCDPPFYALAMVAGFIGSDMRPAALLTVRHLDRISDETIAVYAAHTGNNLERAELEHVESDNAG